jgi:hypothetical protein
LEVPGDERQRREGNERGRGLTTLCSVVSAPDLHGREDAGEVNEDSEWSPEAFPEGGAGWKEGWEDDLENEDEGWGRN